MSLFASRASSLKIGVARSIGRAVVTVTAFILPVAVPMTVRAADYVGPSYSVRAALAAPTPEQWANSEYLELGWDFTNGKPSVEKTLVALATDATSLYVHVVATQRGAVVATQHSDDVGEGSDDEISVYLWPSGANGFRYTFSATPNGTHYQSSTENGSYAPTWISAGHVTATGYEVDMTIPLRSMRAGSQSEWLAQFTRTRHTAGAMDEWSHAQGESTINDASFAGHLLNLVKVASAARTRPRVGLYALGESAAPSAGGPTSRVGADVSFPVTSTASIVAAIHPDFSNVEVDQQTIAPTTFARHFNEVRPFFAQSAQNVIVASCFACPYIQELYTPAIPTPRDGYALEGTQGQLTFGAFDAVGKDRTDAAESVLYTTSDRRFNFLETRVTTNQIGLEDDTQLLKVGYNTLHNVRAYGEFGQDDGTLVLDRKRARRYDAGVLYETTNDLDTFAMRSIGEFYNPLDGLVQLNDIAGYSSQLGHTFQFGDTKRIQNVALFAYVDHYAAKQGGTNQADGQFQLTVYTRTKFSFSAATGFSYTRLPNDILRPANQQGGYVQYQAGSALQDTILYNFGRFADGRLATVDRDFAFRLLQRSTMSVTADDTIWHGDNGTRVVQWLERASLAVDLGPRSSLTFGLRKVIGTAPYFNATNPFVNGTNVSFGLSARRAYDDLYLVYGDASQFQTRPALTLKLVHYFGAEKGT